MTVSTLAQTEITEITKYSYYSDSRVKKVYSELLSGNLQYLKVDIMIVEMMSNLDTESILKYTEE